MTRTANPGPIIPTPYPGSYRVRVSRIVTEGLGWKLPGEGPYSFRGYFRALGELFVSPSDLRLPMAPGAHKGAQGEHPYEGYFALAEAEAKRRTTQPVMRPEELGETELLTYEYRCRTFEASWSNDSQLDLNLGVLIATELGWGPRTRPPIYVVTRPGQLMLLSESRFKETLAVRGVEG